MLIVCDECTCTVELERASQGSILFRDNFSHLCRLHGKSLLSPISQTSKTPSSGISLLIKAFLSSFGGSRTSSSVKTQVPQCIPIALLHWVSLKMFTLSKGFACILDTEILHQYR